MGALTAGFACGEQGELTGISIAGVARQRLCAVSWDFLREAVPCPAHMPPRAIPARGIAPAMRPMTDIIGSNCLRITVGVIHERALRRERLPRARCRPGVRPGRRRPDQRIGLRRFNIPRPLFTFNAPFHFHWAAKSGIIVAGT